MISDIFLLSVQLYIRCASVRGMVATRTTHPHVPLMPTIQGLEKDQISPLQMVSPVLHREYDLMFGYVTGLENGLDWNDLCVRSGFHHMIGLIFGESFLSESVTKIGSRNVDNLENQIKI